MKKVSIEVNETLISVTLNETTAAKDFYSRLPLKVNFSNSGLDYCCEINKAIYN